MHGEVSTSSRYHFPLIAAYSFSTCSRFLSGIFTSKLSLNASFGLHIHHIYHNSRFIKWVPCGSPFCILEMKPMQTVSDLERKSLQPGIIKVR
jgi:hypothetical protein